MNQNLINNLISHKHLGLTFSQDCSSHDHLELVKTNAWQHIKHDLLDRVSTYCQPTVNVFLYGITDRSDVENADQMEI